MMMNKYTRKDWQNWIGLTILLLLMISGVVFPAVGNLVELALHVGAVIVIVIALVRNSGWIEEHEQPQKPK